MEGCFQAVAGFDPLGGVGGEPPGVRVGRYVLLDVFAAAPLEGNQLAVFTDGRGVTGERMLRIACELKLSETVFVLPPQGDGDVRLRIFTPRREIPFAGHPVLGAAVVAARALALDLVRVETGAGTVAVAVGDGGGGAVVRARMDQPLPEWSSFDAEAGLLRALGVARSELPIELYRNGPRHVLVALPDEASVARLDPDLSALTRLGELGVSCFAGSGHRWKTRMFAPALGVPEDPATGSAAGPLGVHLVRHGLIGFGERIELRQGEEIERPSLLEVLVEGSVARGEARIGRVEVGGGTAIVGRGELLL